MKATLFHSGAAKLAFRTRLLGDVLRADACYQEEHRNGVQIFLPIRSAHREILALTGFDAELAV
jgi:hypothetical protein